jgi:hypothetical protein
METKRITVLYFDGCPNWQIADGRLHEALDTAGLTGHVEINYQMVDTPEEAERLGFRGSPTILVDGRDPWSDSGGPVGLSCRIYRTEAGAEGSPSVQQLAEALAA